MRNCKRTIATYYRALVFACALLILSTPCLAADFRVMEYSEDYPPVFFRNDGKPAGIVADVLTAIGDITGDTFTYVQAPFARLQVMFDTGEVDIEPSVNPTWRNQSKVKGVYTIPYNGTVNIYTFPDKLAAFEINSPEDLKGRRVGTVRGYQNPALQPYFDDGSIKEVKAINEDKLMALLANERIDVTILYKPYVQYKMRNTPAYHNIVFGKIFTQQDIMMRFTPAKKDAIPRFNKAIKTLIESGKIKRIKDKYR